MWIFTTFSNMFKHAFRNGMNVNIKITIISQAMHGKCMCIRCFRTAVWMCCGPGHLTNDCHIYRKRASQTQSVLHRLNDLLRKQCELCFKGNNNFRTTHNARSIYLKWLRILWIFTTFVNIFKHMVRNVMHVHTKLKLISHCFRQAWAHHVCGCRPRLT